MRLYTLAVLFGLLSLGLAAVASRITPVAFAEDGVSIATLHSSTPANQMMVSEVDAPSRAPYRGSGRRTIAV